MKGGRATPVHWRAASDHCLVASPFGEHLGERACSCRQAVCTSGTPVQPRVCPAPRRCPSLGTRGRHACALLRYPRLGTSPGSGGWWCGVPRSVLISDSVGEYTVMRRRRRHAPPPSAWSWSHPQHLSVHHQPFTTVPRPWPRAGWPRRHRLGAQHRFRQRVGRQPIAAPAFASNAVQSIWTPRGRKNLFHAS